MLTSRLPPEAWKDLRLLLEAGSALRLMAERERELRGLRSIEDVAQFIIREGGRSEESARLMIRSLVAFATVGRSYQLSGPDYAMAIDKQVESEYPVEWEGIEASAWEGSRSDFAQLVGCGAALDAIVKAGELAYSYSALLAESKILVDIRPVFTDELGISRAIVSFTLSLIYRTGTAENRLDIAIDSGDVDHLKKQCERAIKKATAVSSELACHSWPTFVTGVQSSADGAS